MRAVSSAWLPVPHRAVSDRHMFVIGDVHGHAGLLEGAFRWIRAQERAESPEILMLGDLIHRGPESFRTIDIAWAGIDGFGRTVLLGNHELSLLRFLSGHKSFFDRWVNMGGARMLSEIRDMGSMGLYRETRQAVRARLPEGFEAAMTSRPGYARRGDLVLVHAGVDPHVRDPEAYLARGMNDGPEKRHWSSITDDFSSWTGGWDAFRAKVIVHGHQPVLAEGWQDAFRASYTELARFARLNLDFGCGFVPRLGGAEIRGGDVRFFGIDQGRRLAPPCEITARHSPTGISRAR